MVTALHSLNPRLQVILKTPYIRFYQAVVSVKRIVVSLIAAWRWDGKSLRRKRTSSASSSRVATSTPLSSSCYQSTNVTAWRSRQTTCTSTQKNSNLLARRLPTHKIQKSFRSHWIWKNRLSRCLRSPSSLIGHGNHRAPHNLQKLHSESIMSRRRRWSSRWMIVDRNLVMLRQSEWGAGPMPARFKQEFLTQTSSIRSQVVSRPLFLSKAMMLDHAVKSANAQRVIVIPICRWMRGRQTMRRHNST